MILPAGDSELVQIMDASLADAAQRAGPWLACRPGCTQCCHGAFAINALDTLRLRAGMDALRATQTPPLRCRLRRRARAWLAEFCPDFPGDPVTGLLGTSEADQARFEDFANDAPCPALNPATGLCDVYAWRPMTCRVFGPPTAERRRCPRLLRTLLHRRDLKPKSPPAKCPFPMPSKPACSPKSKALTRTAKP